MGSVVQASMNLADLRRKPVVSMADGVKVGEVDDLVIDTATWSVAELVVDGRSGRGIVPLSAIKGLGPDAATIERSDLVVLNAKPAGPTFSAVTELHVVDGTGTRRGHVSDLRFSSGGAIESFEVTQGGVFGLGAHHLTVTPSEIRGIGDKILTVDLPPVE